MSVREQERRQRETERRIDEAMRRADREVKGRIEARAKAADRRKEQVIRRIEKFVYPSEVPLSKNLIEPPADQDLVLFDHRTFSFIPPPTSGLSTALFASPLCQRPTRC